MIEGIRITISGKELQELCFKRCHYHEKQAEEFRKQISELINPSCHETVDPYHKLKRREQDHSNEALELHFIARHLVVDETYQLSREDLVKLGICRNPWELT